MSEVRKMKSVAVVGYLLLASLIISGPVLAQGDPSPSNCIPGDPTNTVECNPGDPRSNVNVVGMTPDPADFPDRRYRQQNEPACAIRPGDSACIICAYNDYRAVDSDIGFGDAWEGVSQSCDAGDTWLSRLAPGHPLYEPAAYRIPAAFAADPRLAAIPGMAIFNFIAGYRDTNVGVLAIQHWLEVNKEDADFYEPGRETYIADEGTSGRFLDKPDMVAVLDGGTIWLDTVMENSDLGTIGREYPSGKLYVAYAAFTGSNSVKVLIKTSDDWGRTFKNQAMKLSEDQNQVSGITLTAVGNKVLAVWRRKGDGNDVDSIMYSVISNGGKKATKGEVLADVCAFDQPTLTGSETDLDVVTFRTNDFPWTANDGENFYVFYSERARDLDTGACLTDPDGNPNGKPRIVMHHSTLSGQQGWTDYGPIDQTATANTFQFMPTAFGANGKVQVAWYDTRRDPSDPLALPFVADYDAGQFLVNRTVDVFTTNVTIDDGVATVPGPVRASQFSILVNEKADGSREEFETEAAFANKKLFAQGNASFLGDYIAIAAREYRRNSADTAWESNASAVPNQNEDFFVAWTDNRDVRGTIAQITETLDYSYDSVEATTTSLEPDTGEDEDTKQLVADALQGVGPPRDTTQTAEGIDGSDAPSGVCVAETARTRDSNIYGSLIKDAVRIYAANPSKPLSGLQRAFPVVLSNSDGFPKSYTLKIIPGSCSGGDCQASFRQQPLFDSPEYDEPPIGSLNPFLIVPAKSSIARTVFVVGNQSPVMVEARDDAGTLLATIQLANAPQFRDPENCTTSNCSVEFNELHNLELKTVDVHLLDLLTPGDELDALPILSSGDVDASSLVAWAVAAGCCVNEDPASLGSVIEYAVENLADEPVRIDATLSNAALLNAALLNASLLNASLLNASLLNAALLNASLLNSSPTDLTILDSELVLTAIDGGCCYIELEPTYGSVVAWHISNPEFINASLLNASLLNAALLNADLLNASLLNASLLNASLLNASLLNASLLNASLLNAALLNPDIEAAALLNASLLNADLLNASLLNPTMVALAEDGGCCDGSTAPTAVDVIIYAVGHPEIINASLLNAALLNASLLNADLLNASLLNASLLNADLLNANLLNADLLNASLLNANLLNADLLNADLLNASLLNSSLYDTGTGTVTVHNEDGTVTQSSTVPVTFDDYTYPITNNGNVTTAIDSDITINAPMVTVDGVEVMDILGTKLMTWTANATPTVIDCVERVQLNTRVQSIVTSDSSLDVADIDKPFDGQVSGVVAPGETVFVTLRVIGTHQQLKKVRVSGFTASSQAANCYGTANGPVCDTQLNEGIEQITFQDVDPPATPMTANITTEATSPAGATVSWSYFAIDAAQSAPILADCESNSMLSSDSIFPIGVTNVSCTATDFSGNTSAESTFTVTVEDTTSPVISVNNGGNPIVFTANGPEGAWVDLTGIVTASDLGAPIPVVCATPPPVVIGLPELLPPGDHTVICTASDGSSVNVSVQISIDVVDIEAPVLTVPATAFIAVADPDTGTASVDYSTSVSATDNVDLNVAIVCVPPNLSIFPLGDTTVSCTASDDGPNGDGIANTDIETFVVTVNDETAPVISLVGPANITLQAGVDMYTEQGATVVDAGDPLLTTASIGGDIVDPGTVGIYTVTYGAIDASGNPADQVTRTVTVHDTLAPVISLVGPANVTLQAGVDLYTEQGATVLDAGELLLMTVSIGGDIVDPGAAGTYIVTYDATDVSGNPAFQVARTVTVQDTIAPVITLVGSASITLQAGVDNYTEQGATVSDDGDSTVTVITGGDIVDPSTVGTYVVTYDATDASGNPASQATRAVTVQDTTAPVITVPTDPLIIESDTSPVIVHYSDLVSVSDAGYPGTEATCIPASGEEFVWGDTDVTCNAIDGSTPGNPADSATFKVTVRYLYDVNLIPPKGRARAGSTVPLDWKYLDNAVVIDSSTFLVGVTWEKAGQGCETLTPASTDGSSFIQDADSGNSDFRYSSSNNTWQFSWQTPDARGWHKVSVSPPGGDIPGAWACINLK